ncbi:uncharacterized protein LOC141805701 [Halichoeres trimaculatus]|uniref:uncharacterized protein LOC141805701 n=1 Tax=Halichoeres trimaculatus TaxID=147232 RepID=UPI003D9F727E
MAMDTSNIFKTISAVLSQSGSPAVYKLKPKKEMIGNVTRMTIGKKSSTRNETETHQTKKTVLLVGETGTGKSTLINALVNYAMGVKWEDNIWFEIVEEMTGCQSESQTSDVTVYEIFGFEGKTLPYSLTIIDTPGYGDTRGVSHDDIVSQRLLELFHSEGGVHELSAVGLVLKASTNRLSDRQSYIFNSVLSLFGRNMADSIVALVTHSPGRKPANVLKALEVANVKCAKDEKSQPVYFLFDNCQTEDREEDPDALEHADRISMKGMRQFADFLSKSEPVSLQMTVEVMNERMRLKVCIKNLKEKVEFIEEKHRETQGSDGSWSLILRLMSFGVCRMEKSKWLEESFQHIVRLEQIALNADSLSTHVHLDFLIKMMEERGDTEKIQKLKVIKSRVDHGIEAGIRYTRP